MSESSQTPVQVKPFPGLTVEQLNSMPLVDASEADTPVVLLAYDKSNPPRLVRVAPNALGAAAVGLGDAASQAALKATEFGDARRGTFIFDDFNRADAANLGTSASGNTWVVSGAGLANAVIANGRYVNTTTDFSYAYLDFGAAIPRISGTVCFVKGAGTTSRSATSATLIANGASDPFGLATMLHLRIGPDSWVLEKRLSGGSFIIVAQGKHTLAENTPYEISMEIDATAGTCVVVPPQGIPVTVTDADITTINPRYGCWEINNTSTSYLAQWAAVSMGLSQAQRMPAMGAGATGADVAAILGGDGTQRKSLIFTPGTVGWHTVATNITRVDTSISGRMTIVSQDALRVTRWELDVIALKSGTPILAHRFLNQLQTGPVNRVRLSNNGSNAIQLDVYAAQTGMPVNLNFYGDFELIAQPSAGATVLGGTAVTLEANTGSSAFVAANTFGLMGLSTVGDAAATLIPAISTITQIWNTELTADRAVTLSTSNAWLGARFRIVRGASATGAFGLNVGTGPLKALGSASTWCDVEYNGTAWVLTGAGTL